MASNVFWFLYLSMTLCFARNKPQGLCVQVTKRHQGPAGPIGPAGPMGPQGVPGIPGSCACEPSEIQQLRTELQRMNETLCMVGIKDRRIPDSAMTASSYYANGYQAYYGRLDNTGEPRGFWHPSGFNVNNFHWIQVDLGSPTRVTGVITQGRPNHDKWEQWVTSYSILYGNSISHLVKIQDQTSSEDLVFQGNRDRDSKVANKFQLPITARYFRLLVVTYYNAPVIRIEYLTC